MYGHPKAMALFSVVLLPKHMKTLNGRLADSIHFPTIPTHLNANLYAIWHDIK